MLYMFLLHWDPESSEVTGEMALDFHLELSKELMANGKYIISEALGDPETAKTYRLRGGKPLKTDGPFIETKEALAGFYILDCADAEEADAFAERLMAGSGLQAIEIRPVAFLPPWPYEIAADRQRLSA